MIFTPEEIEESELKAAIVAEIVLARKQTVTLRLSPQVLRTAKSLGKGYTSVLSRIIEGSLADEESVYQLSFAILRRIAVTSSRSILPLPFTSAFCLP